MADILIKGLKLPEGANELRLIIRPNGQVLIVKQTYWEETEAIEVPDHGRLIDAETLLSDIRQNSASYFADDFAHEWVDVAPTVIPASGKGTQ